MMNCRKVQQLVTEYLENAIGPVRRARFELHLRLCRSCEVHVEKMAELVRTLGRLPPDTEVPEDLIRHFKDWVEQGPGSPQEEEP